MRDRAFYVFSFFFCLITALIWYEVNTYFVFASVVLSFLILAWILFESKKSITIVALAAVVLGVANIGIHDFVQSEQNHTQLKSGEEIHLSGQVKYIKKNRYFLLSDPKQGDYRVQNRNSFSDIYLGDIVQLSGIYRGIKSKDYFYYKSQSLNGQISSAKILRVDHPSRIFEKLYSFIGIAQDQMLNIHNEKLNDDYAAFLEKILLGRFASIDMPPELNSIVRDLGLSHIFAASGLHVGILCLFSYFLFGLFLKNYAHRNIAVFVVASLYCFLGGWSPSLLRAWSMAGIILLALSLNKNLKFVNLLILVLLFQLFINPNAIGDIGFQFSYLATLGLIIFNDRLVKKFSFLPASWSNAITVPITAQILIIPLQLFYFANLAPYFIIANIVAVPIAGFVLALSLLISVISLLGILGHYIAVIFENLNQLLISLFFKWIYFLSILPGAVGIDLSINGQLMLFLYILIAIGALWTYVSPFMRTKLINIAIASAVLIYFIPVIWMKGYIQLTPIVVSDSRAMLFTIKGWKDRNILVCNDSLDYLNIPLEYVLKTDYKVNHISLNIGTCELGKNIKIRERIIPKSSEESISLNAVNIKYNSKAVLLNYKKLSALTLLQPATEEDQNYTVMMTLFDDKGHIMWPGLPKAQHCILPYLSKKPQTYMDDNCLNLYSHKDILSLETDGQWIGPQLSLVQRK